MERAAAEEYSQSLGQIGNGWWRQIKWAYEQGVPEALGLTNEEWRLAYFKDLRLGLEARREAVMELTAEGLSQREIADVLGVGKDTVRRDRGGANAPIDPDAELDIGADAPWEEFAESVIPEAKRADMELDAALIVDEPQVLETVERWVRYMTPEHVALVRQAIRRLTEAATEAESHRLEVVR